MRWPTYFQELFTPDSFVLLVLEIYCSFRRAPRCQGGAGRSQCREEEMWGAAPLPSEMKSAMNCIWAAGKTQANHFPWRVEGGNREKTPGLSRSRVGKRDPIKYFKTYFIGHQMVNLYLFFWSPIFPNDPFRHLVFIYCGRWAEKFLTLPPVPTACPPASSPVSGLMALPKLIESSSF